MGIVITKNEIMANCMLEKMNIPQSDHEASVKDIGICVIHMMSVQTIKPLLSHRSLSRKVGDMFRVLKSTHMMGRMKLTRQLRTCCTPVTLRHNGQMSTFTSCSGSLPS
ncbi:hypothetical protein TNCV_2105151 [Trichonephila clavipes]|nr:hypothetical protein TNCV_2105151 [Trichonephila clavipes]